MCRTFIENNNVSAIYNITDAYFNEIVEYLNSNLFSTIYHHPLWLRILAEETNQKYFYLIYRIEGKITGLVPLLFTKGVPFFNSPLSSKRISSLPRTPYAGILSNDNTGYCKILEEVKKLTALHNNYLIQLKSNIDYSHIDSDFKSTEWRSSYLKKIPTLNEQLEFDSKKDEKDIFRAIKRAKEKNVIIKKAENLQELKSWYKLYLYIMRQNKIPPRKFSFFENLWKFLHPAGLLDINFAVINKRGEPLIINGNINYIFNKKYFGGFKAGDANFTSYMGGDLIILSELLQLQQQGFLFYDLGEVSGSNKKLDKYKTKWGVEKFNIYHNYYGKVELGLLENLDKRSRNGLSARIWKRLPLNITAKLGGIVNNYL